MSRLIGRYQDACAGAIARFDGYLAKFMGDGVLAYFGYPHAHEDAAERAVRAGLAILAVMAGIIGPDGRKIEARVGIATGLVVVGDIIGSGSAREEAIVGETPNLAARVQTFAAPDTLLVSESTHRLLGRLFEFENLGEHSLKGFAKPLLVWRVLREADVASRFAGARAAAHGPFVGRVQEMGLLLDRWHLARQGEGQVVVLHGEAGMGKSRLIEAWHEGIVDDPHRRVGLQCSPYHANTAFYPVMRQIEQAAGITLADPPGHKLDKLDALLSNAGQPHLPLAPLVAELLSVPADGRYPPIDFTPAQRKEVTIAALIDRLLRLSEIEPVLLVLEDAQWVDPTTQELMTRLVDAIASTRLFAIITARPEFTSPWTGRDHVASLALSRLGKAQCTELIAGIAAQLAVSPELANEIVAKTDGVPLFVEELTRAIIDQPMVGVQVVPATSQDSLVARLDRLGKAKEVAQVAAVIGRQFSHALLAAVAPLGAAELATTLAQLLDAGIVFPQSRATEPSYSFKHALTRDVAYDNLLRSRRQQLHERVARAIEQQFPALAEAEPEIVAHHFSQAGLAGPASIYRERAGDRAVARSAYAEAIAHYAATLTEVARLPGDTDRDRRELTLLPKQGPAFFVLRGANPKTDETYRRAQELAKALRDEPSLFKATWGLWLGPNMTRQTDVARERAEELVVLATQSGDEDMFLEAIHCRWSTAFFRGDVMRTLVDAREGIRHYDPDRHSCLAAAFAGHDPGVCAHAVAGLALAQFGNRPEACESAERGLALAQRLNHPATLVHAIMNAMTTYQLIDDRDCVLRLAPRMIELAGRFNFPAHHAIATFMLGWARATGDGFAEGLAVMEAQVTRASSLGPLSQYYGGLLAGVRAQDGRFNDALALLDPILTAVKEPGVGFYLPEIHRLRGECLLDAADVDAAIRELDVAIARSNRRARSNCARPSAWRVLARHQAGATEDW
jgi:tetratricopeptide (TPR) repeat protein